MNRRRLFLRRGFSGFSHLGSDLLKRDGVSFILLRDGLSTIKLGHS